MKCLITGVAGFIGSHLAQRLLTQGDVVVGLDNFDNFYDPAIKRSNIIRLRRIAKPGFTFVEGDIRDAGLVDSILGGGGFDIIVHLAAKAGVRPSIADPAGYTDVNVNGTAVMLEAARRCGIGKFIFASSSSVYGNNTKVPFAEGDNVDFPISPYAATKKAGELLCCVYNRLFGMDITCMRFFTVYGPRQRPDLAIHKFCRLIEAGSPITVFGDGLMERDFTYIDDIIDGVMAAMKHCNGYEIYNLGESRPLRLDVLIEKIELALGKKAIIERLPDQPGDVRRTYADITKARRNLGYDPRTDIETGLDKFVDWLRHDKTGR